jgi:exonuclease III
MHSKEKRNRVIEWVKTHVCSIAFLQETHIDENIEKEIRNNSKFEIVSSHGTSASRGVSILLNKSFPPNIGIPVPYSFKIELTFLKNAFLAVLQLGA